MRYLIENPALVVRLVGQHLWLTAVSLILALCIALPLGVLAARRPRLRGPLLGVLGVIYTIPSLALFVLLIPVMGLGLVPAVTALVAYAQVILIRNITVGLLGVDPAALEAAQGMGMTPWERFWRVEMPLALPVILAGVRIAVLAIIGIGTIAAFINAGGLGVLLFTGVAQSHPGKIIAGALGASGLALGANWVLRTLENRAARVALGGRQHA
ncbi:MAG: ABC transporter permease [Armatimonadetes bacterium RBG_16_67_12]|nr:MAG: ABC transporter permease [Armatimonadetes bacterium RBG_16_67_12]